MQSSNDCAIRERELPFAIGFDRYVVAQDGTQTVEVSCFMGRGNPLPVAVSVRNFGNEVRCSFAIRASWRGGDEGDKAGHGDNCNPEECDVFHNGSSIRPAFYSNPTGLAALIIEVIDS